MGMAVIAQFFVYMGLGVVAAEFVASSLLGEKSVDYVDDQRDYSHCVNHPESTRGAARALDEPRGLGQGPEASAQGHRHNRLIPLPRAPPWSRVQFLSSSEAPRSGPFPCD